MGSFGIGASVRRKEDLRFLTGKGKYTDDINRPGQLQACLLRSPHAHAEIAGIDTAKAMAAPGCLPAPRLAGPVRKRGRLAVRRPHPLEGRLAEGGADAPDARPGQGA